MKKVIISGYYGCDNFGDEVILSILINKLKASEFKITVFSKNPEKTASTYDVKTLHTFNFFDIITGILKSDYLISGGGSLLQDVTSLSSLIYYLFIIATALFFGKKVIIFAQGIGPINGFITKFITILLLKQCKLVTVRDENSLNLLKAHGIKGESVTDPMYAIIPPKVPPENKIGIQLRSFKTLTDTLLDKLAYSVNFHFKTKQIKIFSLQDSIDLDVCRNFEQILKNINPKIDTEIIYNKTPDEIIKEISSLEYMIAMRFHACLAALKCKVKTLAVCYDIKLETLAQEAHIPAISMNATENYDEIFNILKNFNPKIISEFIDSKVFDWSVFNGYLS